MSTKQQRDEWQRLSDAATAGPWGAEFKTTDEMEGEEYIYSTTAAPENTRTVVGCGWYDGPHLLLRENDADFIAAAREAIPVLLQDVATLTAELTTARNDVVFFAERLEKQDHQYSAAHPQAAIYRNRREELERSLATLTAERDGAVTVADRQRSRAKNAESELQRVKQERDAAVAESTRLNHLINATLKEEEKTEEERDEARAQLAGMTEERDNERLIAQEHEERRDKAEADAAEMRGLLATASRYLTTANDIIAESVDGDDEDFDDASDLIGEIERASAGDAGRALLAEFARLREENATSRVHYEQILAQANIEITDTASKWKHLEAALGRAHAALAMARINSWANATADGSISEAIFDDFVTGHNAKIDAVLADPEGRAAAEYVAALEAEHEAVTAHRVNGASGEMLDAAHAAVEALRGK